jgi:glucose dehydrogenase
MPEYDVIIVGTGHAGAFMAYELGSKGKKVLMLEAGPATPRHREDYMESFYLAGFKSPESPYPPDANNNQPRKTNAPHPTIQQLVFGWDNPEISYLTYTPGSLPFGSTYLKLAGGTGNHWQGTTLRMSKNDFMLRRKYQHGLDWPIAQDELDNHYAKVEAFMGVAGSTAEQLAARDDIPPSYQFPMPPIPLSLSDKYIKARVDGEPLTNEDYFTGQKTVVTKTPQARNSVPYDNRRVCHGNTNCVPICPIQAKYDAAYALGKALATGFVTVKYKTVVDKITVGEDGKISGLHYLTYDDISVPAKSGQTGQGTAAGTVFVLAASAIENARILLNSPWKTGMTVANSSDQVGRNLMDHATYLAWGLMPVNAPAYSYRGPLATSGIESLRDGPFRSTRASWRLELGNEGWNWAKGEPYAIGPDFLYGKNNGGLNNGGTNGSPQVLGNKSLLKALNGYLTRQFRIAFLVEQDAEQSNRVQLSPTETDNLGIPRPLITYNLSDYTRKGFISAKLATTEFMRRVGAQEYTQFDAGNAKQFTYEKQSFNYYGAGHVCGTHVMGSIPHASVVNYHQQSWDHSNLYIVGCGSMPSISSQNPTLTMLAVTSMTVDHMLTRV